MDSESVLHLRSCTSNTMVRRSHQYSYIDLRGLVRQSLETCPDFAGKSVEVDGKINNISEGMWHENYWFWLRGQELTPAQSEQAYILRILDQREDWQRGPGPHDRLIREAETLQVLEGIAFPHLTPRFICFVKCDGPEPIGMIETSLPGHSLHGYKEKSTLEQVAQVAADVHRLKIDSFPHLPGHHDRRRHIRSTLAELDDALFERFATANLVREWMMAHMPDADGGTVLHGDLIPQNLLRELPGQDREEPRLGVIDWEMAQIGDPAYDLAIVSRGDRKVQRVRNGLKVLVDHYLKCGGQPISVTDVRRHELLLVLHWLEESWREYQKPSPSGHGPDYYEAKLRTLFQRVAN